MSQPTISPDMTINDLLQWAVLQRERLRKDANAERASEPALVLAQAAKLTEEVGELQAEILGHAGYQRKSKNKVFDADSMGAELADVTICVAILAVAHNIDLGKALARKMVKVESRYSEPESR